MAALTLSELHVYPIKSAAGIALREGQMTARGLQYDRRWMVVNASGKFMTQRQFPKMALISVAIGDQLTINAPDMPELSVPLEISPKISPEISPESESHRQVTVEVWGDRCEAIALGTESKQWFTRFMGIDCQLVYMPNHSHRPTDHGRFGDDQLVSFADAYPYLLISEASLAGLNQRLLEKGEAAVTMARFRPNLVVKGCREAHEEDTWQQIRIGAGVFELPKLCDRCSIPGVNPHTGIQGQEPTKTLATYRYQNRGIWFGQNCIQIEADQRADQPADQPAGQTAAQTAAQTANQTLMRLQVGDAIEILRYKTP